MELIKSILAGIMIGISCRVFLSCDNTYIGALLFSIGLLTILRFNFNLFTGKICYALRFKDKQIEYIMLMFVILVGNIIGCLIVGLLNPLDTAQVLCQNKLETNILEAFIKAIFCNILIYIAVESYNTDRSLLLTVFCVPVFILSGFEHSIADICYFIMARNFSIKAIIFIIVVIIGNTVGGLLIPCCNIIGNKLKARR